MLLTKLLRTSVATLGALAVASVTQANAADIYSGGGYKDVPVVAPCCSFSGFYIGGNMGMAWSEIDHKGGEFEDRAFSPWASTPQQQLWLQQQFPDRFGNFNNEKLRSTNGFGGGQFGYNYQSACCWLYGIEVDLGAIGLNNRSHRFMNMPDDWRMVGVSMDGRNKDDAVFAGDVTGRLGYTFGNSLVYVKGGFAFINADDQLNETIFFTPQFAKLNNMSQFQTFGNGNNNNFLTGWTVGAGYEWKPCCQSNWSIKVEYLHFDFRENNNNCCNDIFVQKFPDIVNNRFRNNNDLTADTVKIGFNYFLNAAPVVAPLK